MSCLLQTLIECSSDVQWAESALQAADVVALDMEWQPGQDCFQPSILQVQSICSIYRLQICTVITPRVMQVALPSAVFVFDLLRLSAAPELQRCVTNMLGSSVALGLGIGQDVHLLCKATPVPSTCCLLDLECVSTRHAS